MYNYSRYNVINVPFPDKGMNRNVSSEILPANRTHTLENILPLPLGEGNVRFGTRLEHKIDELADILEIFGFVTLEGKKQLVIYGTKWVVLQSQYYHGANEATPSEVSGSKLELKMKETVSFLKDTPKLRIVYKNKGTHTDLVIVHSLVEDDKNLTFEFENAILPATDNQLVEISFQVGCLRVYDIESKTIILHQSKQLKHLKDMLDIDELSANCIPRSVVFQNKLLICNGVDKMRVWDGENMDVLIDYVSEHNAKPNINGKVITLSDIKDKSKYVVNGYIKLKIDEKWHGPFTIEKFEGNKITVTEDLPTLGTVNILYYSDLPPAFSYLYVFQHRIWALGEGAVSQGFRKNPMRVYYTQHPNEYDGWFREEPRSVPYIDISYKHNEVDNLEAIHSLGEKLIFIGRNQTQVWMNGATALVGNDQTPVYTKGKDLDPKNYTWESTVNGGVVHGNLIVKMPNDLLLVSQNGIMQFSTLNVAKQFSISSVNAVDPLVRQYIDTLAFSPYKYKQCRSFVYHQGPFIGFKIGANPVLAGVFDTNVRAWSMFSGSFKVCATLNSHLNQLFMAVGNRLLSYGDARLKTPEYSDEGRPISFLWSLPVFKSTKQPFMSKRFELDLSYPSAFVTKDENYISLLVTGDLPREFTKGVQYEPVSKGDLLSTVKLALDDEDESDYLEFGTKAKTIKKRLRFVSQKFWATVYGQSSHGPIKIKSINFFGSK